MTNTGCSTSAVDVRQLSLRNRLQRGRIRFAVPFIAFIGPSLLLSGCTVGPRYRPPTATLQPFHNAPSIESRSAPLSAPPLDVWWTGFQDAELNKVVQRALDQNLDLAAALTRVQQAGAAARLAGAQRLPAGSVTASTTSLHQSLESPFGRLSPLIPGYNRDQNYYDLGLGATWEADLFGGLQRGAEAATAEAQAAAASQAGTRISIAAEAADAYMQIRSAQTRLGFAKEQIATDEHLVDLVRQRRIAGIASDRELAQAESVLSQAKATIPLLKISLESQLNRMDVLMGSQPGTYAAELRTAGGIPLIPAIPSPSTPTELLRRRPDIIAAEREVAASNARIGQALAEYYPKLSLSGLLGSQAIAPYHLFQQQGFQPIGIVGLRWRLFDFGRVDAEVKEAKGANAEAILKYRNSVLHAAADVEDAFTMLVQSEDRSVQIALEIEQLQRVRDRSQESYVAGVIALTDVLDADRQLLVAKDDLAVSRETAARAAVGSFRALGGGWAP
jgi:NodT family efflux transporter outer membrane factor (OMF) lipoprotein